jgi:hypothetical protein
MLIAKGDDISIEAQRPDRRFVSRAEQMSTIPLLLSPFLSHHVGRSRLVSGGGSNFASHWAWIEKLARFGQSAVRNERRSVSRASPCLASNLTTL